MKKLIVAVMATLIALVAVAPAQARSYQASAARHALKWAKSHHPRSTTYANVECYLIGYRKADCTIDFTTYSGACRYAVTVSGPRYRVRRYDSSC
jgi:hypothetical protein